MIELEKGLVYSFAFTASARLKVGRIAHELAISKGKNKKTALKQFVGAFMGRPIRMASEELQSPKLAHIEKQLTECQDKKLLSRVTTLSGVDTVRRRGQSRSLARQAVVRTWPYKGIKHPGHATLSIKDSSPERDKPKHVYFSWWPSSRINSRYNRILKKLGLDELTQKTARNVAAYKLDKRDEMGSAQNSCSGMILQALREGGAGHYIKTNDAWFVSDPNMIHAMTVRLQEKVDELNSRAEAITSVFNEQLQKMVEAGVVTSYWTGIVESLGFVSYWQASSFSGLNPDMEPQKL